MKLYIILFCFFYLFIHFLFYSICNRFNKTKIKNIDQKTINTKETKNNIINTVISESLWTLGFIVFTAKISK